MTKKGKTIQLQNPENYIRTRARNLRIFECLINSDWKEGGIANIVVARKHTNDNITAAVYLVDLYCLGVKNTTFMFNESEPFYREKFDANPEMSDFTKIEYALAHNIIFSAVEFAGDYGFNPDKLFTSVTQYMLEEDTEDIELIDIECGLDGKPAYFQGPNDSNATVSRIVNQLERSAGKGNYDFTQVVGFDKDEVRFDEGEEDELAERISFKEAAEVFRQYESKIKSMKKHEAESFFEAVEVLFDSLVEEDAYQKYFDEFMEDLDIDLVEDEIPDEMLGLPTRITSDIGYLKSKLNLLLYLPDKKNKKALKLLAELQADFPDVAFVSFLELYFEKDKASKRFEQILKRIAEQFPGYPLLQISTLMRSQVNYPDQASDAEIIPLHDLFPGRVYLHDFEMQHYLVYAIFVAVLGEDKSRLAAFYEVLTDLEFPDDFMELAHGLIVMEKIKNIQAMLGISK